MFLVCVRACAHACTHIHCVCIWFAKFMRTFTHTHKQVRMHTKHKYKYARINGCTHAGRVWLGGVVRKGGPVKVLSGLPDGLTEQPDPPKVCVYLCDPVCLCASVSILFCQETGLPDGLTEQPDPPKVCVFMWSCVLMCQCEYTFLSENWAAWWAYRATRST